MFPAMSCYDFAMFRKTGGQRGRAGHGRARRRLAILSTPVLSLSKGMTDTYNPRLDRESSVFAFLLYVAAPSRVKARDMPHGAIFWTISPLP